MAESRRGREALEASTLAVQVSHRYLTLGAEVLAQLLHLGELNCFLVSFSCLFLFSIHLSKVRVWHHVLTPFVRPEDARASKTGKDGCRMKWSLLIGS